MTRFSRQIALWLTLGLLSLVVWACGPGEVTVEKPVTRLATQKKESVETVVVTVEKPVIVTEKETVQVVITSTPTPLPEGGFVTRTTYADAQTLNPILAADEGSIALCALMFEGLLRVDPFVGEWVPNLAEAWTVSDDGLVYTFTVRSEITWSDGHPITAHDFHFSYAALMSGVFDTPNLEAIANIEQIEVLDDHTLAVTFDQAGCDNLRSLQLGWLPMHVFTEDVTTYDWNELAGHEFNSTPTVFSGPFVLKEWVRGDHWTQVRNKRYWRGAPHLEGVITRVVGGQSEMVDLLAGGKVDVGVGFDPQYLVEVEQSPSLRIYKFLSDEYDFLGFQLGDPDDPRPRLGDGGAPDGAHGDHPILWDRRVRQAIVHALDRQEIVAQGRLGQGIPLHANVLPTVAWAYNTDLEPREYNLDDARRLLDEAGWHREGESGTRSKEGVPLRLKLYTNAANTVRETMAEVVRQQLIEVGIEVEVIALDWYALLDVLYGQTFDMVLVSWSNLGVDPDDRRFWQAHDDRPGEGSNFVSYYNPVVEELFAKAASLVDCDQDARAEIYRQIQAQLYEDQPYVWLDVPRKLVAIGERVGGVNPGPWSVWYNVHEWYISE